MVSSDIEKAGFDEVDNLEHTSTIEKTSTQAADRAAIDVFTAAEQKKIIRRIDFRLVTTLGVLYCASLMDRTNLGSAAIAG